MPAEFIAQLAHRQPCLRVGRQPLRRGQLDQQAGRLRLIAGAKHHAAELTPGVLVAAANQGHELAARLVGITAVQRQLGARLG